MIQIQFCKQEGGAGAKHPHPENFLNIFVKITFLCHNFGNLKRGYGPVAATPGYATAARLCNRLTAAARRSPHAAAGGLMGNFGFTKIFLKTRFCCGIL